MKQHSANTQYFHGKVLAVSISHLPKGLCHWPWTEHFSCLTLIYSSRSITLLLHHLSSAVAVPSSLVVYLSLLFIYLFCLESASFIWGFMWCVEQHDLDQQNECTLVSFKEVLTSQTWWRHTLLSRVVTFSYFVSHCTSLLCHKMRLDLLCCKNFIY